MPSVAVGFSRSKDVKQVVSSSSIVWLSSTFVHTGHVTNDIGLNVLTGALDGNVVTVGDEVGVVDGDEDKDGVDDGTFDISSIALLVTERDAM